MKSNPKARPGTSVIICCYNSGKIITKTLDFLIKQKTPHPWEILVINNNSSDNLIEKIDCYVEENNIGNIRLINEPIPGLSYARRKGVINAKYDYIIFCDDDNWLNDDYLFRAYELLSSNQEYGIIGGKGTPHFEDQPPEWFEEYASHYAVGPQFKMQSTTRALVPTDFVYGAGMVIKKNLLIELYNSGFTSLLTDRKGNSISSGGDQELCYAVQFSGMKIGYSPLLEFEHYISKDRLNRRYLRSLFKASGKAGPIFRLYKLALAGTRSLPPFFWFREVVFILRKILLNTSTPNYIRVYYWFYLLETVQLNQSFYHIFNSMIVLKAYQERPIK